MIRGKTSVQLSPQELADLMSVLGVAIWIRSLQLDNRDAILKVPGGAEVDTHDLCEPVCRAQMDFAQKFWRQANQALEALGAKNLPTWHHLSGKCGPA